jgi:hypothetical protein
MCACPLSYGSKCKIEESWYRPAWAKNVRPYYKNKQSKKAGGLVQGVEHLPNKHKALSSNPALLKKKREREGRKDGRKERREGGRRGKEGKRKEKQYKDNTTNPTKDTPPITIINQSTPLVPTILLFFTNFSEELSALINYIS